MFCNSYYNYIYIYINKTIKNKQNELFKIYIRSIKVSDS